jgi:hypothetical protein
MKRICERCGREMDLEVDEPLGQTWECRGCGRMDILSFQKVQMDGVC